MSVRMLNRVFDDARARGEARLLLLAIANFADNDGLAWPSIATLVRTTRMPRRSLCRQLVALEASGELLVEHRHGRGHTNRYVVAPGHEKGANLTPFPDPQKVPHMTPFLDGVKGAKSHRKGAKSREKVPYVAHRTVNRTVNRTVSGDARARARANHHEKIFEETRKYPLSWDPADPANWLPEERAAWEAGLEP
jgi:hypothetical protein